MTIKSAQTPADTKPEEIPADTTRYQQIIGSLMHLAIASRADIAVAVNICARFAARPSEAHVTAAKRILRYLRGTTTKGIKLGGLEPPKLIGYSDSDWVADLTTRRSTTGYAFTFNGLISWKVQREKSVALSSTEAEYVALMQAGKEAVWLRGMLADLRIEVKEPTTIFEDNQGSIAGREQEEEGGSPGPSSAAIGPAMEGKGKGRPELEWDEEEEPAAPEEATEVEGDRKGKGRVQGRVLAGREAAAAGFVAEKTTTKDRQGQQKGKLRTVTQRVSRYWLRGRMIPKEESPMALDEPAGNVTESAAAAAERELSPMSLDVSVHSTLEVEPPIFFLKYEEVGPQCDAHPKLEVQRLKDMRAVFVRVRGQESADAELQLPSHRL